MKRLNCMTQWAGRLFLAACLAVMASAILDPTASRAAETILNYNVTVEPARNGDIRVTEKIVVHAEGKKIRRGIYRDFPLENRQSYQPRIPYRDIVAKRNSYPESIAKTEETDVYYRVYLGKAGRFLRVPQTYRYEIGYTIPYGVLQFDEHDEIYLNAVPTGWDFPIQKASVTVLLPDGMQAERLSVFSGPFGARDNKLAATGEILDGGNRVVVETTEALPPRNGITIAVKLPSTAVDQTYVDPGLKTSIVKLLAVFCFVLAGFAIWVAMGRDPVPETIIPQFDPPSGISPAAARYIYNFGNVDGSHLMATAVVSAASKGAIRIEDDGETIVSTGRNFETLSQGERKLLTALFRISETAEGWTEGETFTFSKSQSTSNLLATGWADMHEALEGEFAQSHFRKNVGPRGFLLALGGFIALFTAFYAGPGGIAPTHALSLEGLPLILFAFFVGGRFIVNGLKKLHPSRILNWNSLNSKASRKLHFFIAAVGALALTVPLLLSSADIHQWIAAYLILVLAITVLVFDQLYQSRTVQGAADVAYLQGLRMYIAAAEHNQFKDLEPAPTPEQFTKLYPYAYALKLNNVWVEKYAAQLSDWLKSDTADLDWYYGSDGHDASRVRFDRLGRSVESSNSGAQYKSESSNVGSGQYSSSSFGGGGFGGGGFSGGGGGGGGGGGW